MADKSRYDSRTLILYVSTVAALKSMQCNAMGKNMLPMKKAPEVDCGILFVRRSGGNRDESSQFNASTILDNYTTAPDKVS